MGSPAVATASLVPRVTTASFVRKFAEPKSQNGTACLGEEGPPVPRGAGSNEEETEDRETESEGQDAEDHDLSDLQRRGRGRCQTLRFLVQEFTDRGHGSLARRRARHEGQGDGRDLRTRR